MIIDFSNIEELIFTKEDLKKQLPEFHDLFQQWKLGQFAPSLRPMARKALFDLLNRLGDEHIDILEKYFKTTIEVNKFNYNVINKMTIPVSETCIDIEGELFLHRDENHIYIGSWR